MRRAPAVDKLWRWSQDQVHLSHQESSILNHQATLTPPYLVFWGCGHHGPSRNNVKNSDNHCCSHSWRGTQPPHTVVTPIQGLTPSPFSKTSLTLDSHLGILLLPLPGGFQTPGSATGFSNIIQSHQPSTRHYLVLLGLLSSPFFFPPPCGARN